MNPEQMESLSENDKKLMGLEDKKEQNPFVDGNGIEKPFSEEGILNRNFGKDLEKPSSSLFYRDGILNRAQFHEQFTKVYDQVMNPEAPAAIKPETPTQSADLSGQESAPVDLDQAVQETSEVQADQAMSDLFDVFKDEKDPEGAAFQYIKTHLDPSLTMEEQLDKIREFKQEYLKHKNQLKS